MGRITAKKPSPAMVISIVALVFAVAGTAVASVATVSVLSKKEKKQTRNIAQDAINKLAPGLHVAKANSADSATNAMHVNGLSVVKINSRQSANAPAATILDLAGLRLQASCPAGLDVVATTTKQNSSLYGYADYPPNLDYDSFDYEGGGFDTGTNVDLDTELDGLGAPRVGALVYEAPDGAGVTVQFAADNNGTSACIFTGTAIGG